MIEYLYGKKLAISMPIHKVAKVLAGLPNERFGINDIQVAHQLVEGICRVRYDNLQDKYDALQKLGIKPASKLSRWSKLRNLKLR